MATKPVCAKCALFFRPKKNGFAFIEGMPRTDDAPPGRRAPEQWRPYKLWTSDLWECPDCGVEICLSGSQPIAVQHEPEFQKLVDRLAPELQVNDC